MSPPGFVPVALATLESHAPQGDDWVHEEKLDGYRIEAVVTAGGCRLYSRNEKDWTARFPQVAEILSALPMQSMVLDGEIVALDDDGRTSFQQLQQSLEQHEMRGVRYHVFDILSLDGADLRVLPFALRRDFLRDVLRAVPPGRDGRAVVRATREFHVRDGDPLAQACTLGIEGVVSKRADSTYPVGRSPLWIKSKCSRRQEFVIVGFTDPQGARDSFGALLIGVYDGRELRYAGKVGTGFDVATLRTLRERLRPLETDGHDIAHKVGLPRTGVHWVKPKLVAEILFTEWTSDGLLRHPVFKGLRADKPARDVRRED